MEFEWDEKKARANLEKHGIDFQGAIRVFEAEAVLDVRSLRGSEERWKAIGVVEGVVLRSSLHMARREAPHHLGKESEAK